VLDAYTRRARLAPAALAALPALALLGSSLLDISEAGSALAFALGAVGAVICGIVRHGGLSLQPALWKNWGGAPTTRRLRWRGNDGEAVRRLHQRLAAVSGEALPTQEEEVSDPVGADRRYEEVVAYLREATRNHDRFPLVHEENTEYGFRRNCLGLRPTALILAAVIGGASAILIVTQPSPGRYWLAAAVSVVALVGWWRLVTEEWVRQAAELYADRLFEAAAGMRN
jgi:hypothetical protein